MTQADGLLVLLRQGPKTLGEILKADFGRFAPEYRRVFSDLRKAGYDITWHHVRRDGSCEGCGGLFALGDCPARIRGESCYKLHSEPQPVMA